MAFAVMGLLLFATGFARLAGRDGEHPFYDVLAALFLIGALSLLGNALGIALPL